MKLAWQLIFNKEKQTADLFFSRYFFIAVQVLAADLLSVAMYESIAKSSECYSEQAASAECVFWGLFVSQIFHHLTFRAHFFLKI